MTDKTVKSPRKVVDWEALRPHYEANIRPLKDLGAEYGVSDAGIIKHAKKNKWTRELGAKIRARAEAKVSAAAVSVEVSVARAANDQQVIEANSELQYKIRLSQRDDIQRNRRLMLSLLSELEQTTDNIDLFEKLGELLDESGPDSNGTWRKDKLNEIYRKVISMSGRIGDSKTLVDVLEKLVKLERQAFGIKDDVDEGKGGVEDKLANIFRKLETQANE